MKSRKVAIVGYGSQGRAHALNRKDSGAKDVVIAFESGSATPDGLQAVIYKADIEGNIREGAAIAFAHGLNIHFGPTASIGNPRVINGLQK